MVESDVPKAQFSKSHSPFRPELTHGNTDFGDADEDEDKKLDDVQSNSSTIRTAAADHDEPPVLTAPKSAAPMSIGSHDAPMSMAEVEAREQEAQGIAAEMEKRVRDLTLNGSAAQNGHERAPKSPSIHMRNAMNRHDGSVSPPSQTKGSPGNGAGVEHVQC